MNHIIDNGFYEFQIPVYEKLLKLSQMKPNSELYLVQDLSKYITNLNVTSDRK